MTKFHYEVTRGTLHLNDGSKIVGAGSTSDKGQIEEIKRLAEVKDAMGKPQYVRIVDGKGEAQQEQGQNPPRANPPANTGQATDPPTFIHPPATNESEVNLVLGKLTEGGLTFESANLLSDDEIKAKATDIGVGRLKLIRAVGAVNAYPAYIPPAE